MRDRNLFRLRLERGDYAKDTASTPLGPFRVRLLCQIALRHHDNHQGWHRFEICRDVAARHDAIAFREVSKSHITGVGK
jgi:hypothetical protein